MNFCSECDNYLSLQMKEMSSSVVKDKLVYICKNCGFEKEYNSFHGDGKKEDKNENCIYKNYYDKNEILKSNKNIMNYIDKDPTLPRVTNITCPNEECVSNTNFTEADFKKYKSTVDREVVLDKDGTLRNEVVYIIINEPDMIFQYVCCHCKSNWTNA